MSKMSKKVLTFICLVSFISIGNFAAVPNLTKCLSTDNKCLKSSAQALLPIFAKGLPEYGVEPLDPVTFKKPIDASAAGLKLIINNFVVKGMKDCVLKKISRDVPNSKLMGKILCNVVGDGDYEMDGQLLILKVQGKGKIHVVLRKIVISLEADMGEKVKDGVKYWDVKRFTHSFELMDKADVVFENLFSGNDVLGRAASQVLESSGNDIINEVGPPVIKVISTKVVETIRKFFNNVPPEDLALD